ncbi:MAG: hypothetical protein HZA58_08215 [Acidimicrobiia bacterium]|nr:hypothetical protein [Acidimicrobiia bacterium]
MPSRRFNGFVNDLLLTFEVRAVDGEVMAVPELEVGARFSYPQAASTWSTAITNGDGVAIFRDQHPETPQRVCLYVGDERCGTFDLTEGASIVLEV